MTVQNTQGKPYIVLITGSNRGIGQQFLETLVKRDNTILIAAVRKPQDETSKALLRLTTGKGSEVKVVKYDSLSLDAAKEAVEELKSNHGIKYLDLVIANAGISNYQSVLETPIKEIKDHFEINTLGPIILFQAVYPLLKSSKTPIFVALSTIFASIADQDKYPFPYCAYGASKTAINFFVRKIHFEHPDLIAFTINPGWVQTEMGNHGAVTLMGEGNTAPLTREDSVHGMLKQIDEATRESASGHFKSYDGSIIPW